MKTIGGPGDGVVVRVASVDEASFDACVSVAVGVADGHIFGAAVTVNTNSG